MPGSRHSFRRFAASALSGGALVFAFPTFDYYPLAWFCLFPFLVAASNVSSSRAFALGIVTGLPYFMGTQYWIYHSINHFGNVSFSLSVFLVFLLCLYESLFVGLFGMLYSRCMRSENLPALLVAPTLWVSIEFARSYALTGFPWSSLGYSQYKFLHIIQFAEFTGIYGVSFLLMAVNGALADVFITRKRLREMPLFTYVPTVAGYVVILVLAVGAVIFGAYRLNEKPEGKTVKVSLIQGNIEQDVKWDAAHRDDVMETYMRMSTGASFSSPDLIVWPETAAPFYFGFNKELTDTLSSFTDNRNIYLLFGAVTVKEQPDKGTPLLANSAILLEPDGSYNYVYDKIHMVPFGEYVPLRKILFFVDKLATGIGDYTPGEDYKLAHAPFGDFATVICYEIIFPGLVRKFFREGGDFLVNITNDAWFGETNGPYQHWSMAAFRAVENRKPVVRAANTGISGFVDYNGRIIKSSELFSRMTLLEKVNTNDRKTFYTSYGDLFSFMCIIGAVFMILNIKKRRRI